MPRTATGKRTRRGPAVGRAVLALLLAACEGGPPSQEAGPGGERLRRGTASEAALRYVALGDSIPAGIGSGRPYPVLYARLLEADLRVDVTLRNLAVGGSTTADLLRRVRTDGRTRRSVGWADVVTVTVGGNDLSPVHTPCRPGDVDCYRRLLPSLLDLWEALLVEVLRLRRDAMTPVLATNYYDPIPGNPRLRAALGSRMPAEAELDEARALIRDHNRGLCRVAAAHDVPCADVYGAFNGSDGSESAFDKGLMARDAFHPSARGQRVIAALLRGLGYRGFRAPPVAAVEPWVPRVGQAKRPRR